MAKKLKTHQVWFRESNSWPARSFRRWAEGRDVDWWADAVGMTIGVICVTAVFVAIVISESLTL